MTVIKYPTYLYIIAAVISVRRLIIFTNFHNIYHLKTLDSVNYKPRTYNTVRASYFSIRIVNVWNSLPADRVDFSSFASFKRTVQQIDFTPFLLCSHT